MINRARFFYGFFWVNVVWCIASVWIFLVGHDSKAIRGWNLSIKDLNNMKHLSILSFYSCYGSTVHIFHEVC
jgi:hypothetical protein